MPSQAGYIPSFEDRLAEFFMNLSGLAGNYGKFAQGQEALQQTESNQYLQRLLGFNQLESLNEERGQKREDFRLRLEESKRAALAAEQGRADVLSERKRVAEEKESGEAAFSDWLKLRQPQPAEIPGEPGAMPSPSAIREQPGMSRMGALAALGRRAGRLPQTALAHAFDFEAGMNKPIPGSAEGLYAQEPKPGGGFDLRELVAPRPKEPPAPSPTRDYHAIARQNRGPTASDADVAKEARRLSLSDQKDIAGVRASAAPAAREPYDIAREGREDTRKRKEFADKAELDMAATESVLAEVKRLIPATGSKSTPGQVYEKTVGAWLAETGLGDDARIRLSQLAKSTTSLIAKSELRQSGILSNQDINYAMVAQIQVGDKMAIMNDKIRFWENLQARTHARLQAYREGLPIPSDADLNKQLGLFDPPSITGGLPPGVTIQR